MSEIFLLSYGMRKMLSKLSCSAKGVTALCTPDVVAQNDHYAALLAVAEQTRAQYQLCECDRTCLAVTLQWTMLVKRGQYAVQGRNDRGY